MKILKKIIKGLLTLVLIDLILILIISFTFKSVLINDILIESINPENSETFLDTSSIDTILEETGISNKEVVYEILKSDEINSLMNKYMDDFIKNISNEDENINATELERKMIEYLKNNKETLKQATGVDITDEMIDSATSKIEGIDNKKATEQAISNIKNNLTKKEISILKLFDFITTSTFKLVISILIIVDIILIALIELSLYKWIKSLSYAMIVSGLGSVIISLGIKVLIASLTLMTVKIKSLMTIGLIVLLFGMTLLILYKVMIKYCIKEKENEISKVLTGK